MKQFLKRLFCGHIISPEFRKDKERKRYYRYCEKCCKKFWID